MSVHENQKSPLSTELLKENLSQKEKGDLIAKVLTFEDLYKAIRKIEEIKEGSDIYTSKKMEDLIQKAYNRYMFVERKFSFKKEERGMSDELICGLYLDDIPEILGIRKKVLDLLKNESYQR